MSHPEHDRSSDSSSSSSDSSTISFRCLTPRGVETFEFEVQKTSLESLETMQPVLPWSALSNIVDPPPYTPYTPYTPGDTHVRVEPPSSHPDPDPHPRSRLHVRIPTPHPTRATSPATTHTQCYPPPDPGNHSNTHTSSHLVARVRAIPKMLRPPRPHRANADLFTRPHSSPPNYNNRSHTSPNQRTTHVYRPRTAIYAGPTCDPDDFYVYNPIRPRNSHAEHGRLRGFFCVHPSAYPYPRNQQAAMSPQTLFDPWNLPPDQKAGPLTGQDLFFNSIMSHSATEPPRCPLRGRDGVLVCDGILDWDERYINRVICLKCRRVQVPTFGDLEPLNGTYDSIYD